MVTAQSGVIRRSIEENVLAVITELPGKSLERFKVVHDFLANTIDTRIKWVCNQVPTTLQEAHKNQIVKAKAPEQLVHLIFEAGENPSKFHPWILDQILRSGQHRLVVLGGARWKVTDKSVAVERVANAEAMGESGHVLLELHEEPWPEIAGTLLEVMGKAEGKIFLVSRGRATEELEEMVTHQSEVFQRSIEENVLEVTTQLP